MLALLTVVLIGQARIEPIPACQPHTYLAVVGGSQIVKGKAVSQSPAIATVKGNKLVGIAPGWAVLKGVAKGQPALVCVFEGEAYGHCNLCGLPMSVKFGATAELVGEYADLDAWKKVHAATLMLGMRAPPAPLAFAERIAEAANASLVDAAVAPRLSIVATMPVLDPLPKDEKERAATSAALEPHLPLLIELLAR